MKKTCLGVFMAGLMVLVSFGTVTAGTQKGDYFVSPMIGGHLFEGNQYLDHRVTYGLGLGYQLFDNFGFETMFNFTPTESDLIDKNVDVFPFRFDGYLNFLKTKKIEPYIAAGIGVISFKPENADSEHNFLANYGVGIKYFLTDNLALRGDVRHLISFNERYNNLLYTVGLTYAFGCKKEPVKAVEKAPEPVPAPVVVKKEPEPAPAPAPVVVKKEPEPAPVPVVVKKEPEPAPVPAAKEEIDKTKDSDNDGVPDYLDKCPGTPKGAKVDERGCWVIKDLKFESGKSVIKRESYKELDNILVVLKLNPEIKLEIQGYTDNKGNADKNRELSDRRAKAVMKYFISKGVKKDRLSSKGYGVENPIAPNDTPEGCAKNRRVELKPIL